MRTNNFAPNPRPFVFNPSRIHPPRSVRPLNLSAGSPAAPLALAGSHGPRPDERPHPTPTQIGSRKGRAGDPSPGRPTSGKPSPLLRTSAVDSEKSVVIRDSSDDEFSVDLELPEDALEQNSLQPGRKARGGAPDRRISPESSPAPPFDPELDTASSLAALKAQLADDAARLIQDMESMADSYSAIIDKTVKLQLRHKQLLVEQWEETKRNSQTLLASVKARVSDSS
ncbi:hypothetical protein LPJ61_001168 [Coemansia biformis]|uniref:Uncharacterized protein n=1 Tax=Coemansia biformis TaxID=1286918 RepID=A0A9W7YAH9_9FUNG|nr:hypothetical protein LPJ61_001168 [Coemansia biformis]